MRTGISILTVDHPNIVKIHDYGNVGESYRYSRHYIVMEYLSGRNLTDHLKKTDGFSLRQVIARILPLIHDRLKKAHISQQIMMAYFRKCDFDACEKWAKSGLEILDESLPISRPAVLGRAVKESVRHLLSDPLPIDQKEPCDLYLLIQECRINTHIHHWIIL